MHFYHLYRVEYRITSLPTELLKVKHLKDTFFDHISVVVNILIYIKTKDKFVVKFQLNTKRY